MSGYRFIDTQQSVCPVRCLCRVLGVAPSRYYARQRGRQRAIGEAALAWETALVALFARHMRRYGTRRLRVALHQEGHWVGRKACTPRTMDPPHGLRCAPNRLLGQPKPTQANRVWVSDITYLPLANGAWAYLCAFQDVASKLVVDWHVLGTLPAALVTTALQAACLPSRPPPAWWCIPTAGGSTAATPTGPCSTGTKPCARKAGAASTTTMPTPKAAGPGSKPKNSNGAGGRLRRISRRASQRGRLF